MTPGDQELERRLEAYADARLSPSLDSTTRTRAAVMAAAHRQVALIAADTAAGAGATDQATNPSVTGAPSRAFWTAWRRVVVAVVVGCLAVGILAGSAFASHAGGPLYGARLWVEMATLPTDLPARAEAEARRLQARINEAQEASAAGDSGATEAALVAYSTIVVEAARDSAGDATARSTIEASVQLHVTVLTTLAADAPASARAAAQNALTQSTDTLRDLKDPGGAVDGPGSNPALSRGGSGHQGSKGHPAGNGNATGASGDCPPTSEPSDGTIATLDGDAATCDPNGADPAPGTNGANSDKALKLDPTARPTEKAPPPGRSETKVQPQPSHQVSRPNPTANPNAKGSPQDKAAESQVTPSQSPDPCESPKPGPDAHKS